MDEFRAPSRPARVGGTPYDVPVRAGVTQTPVEPNVSPIAVVVQPQAMITPAVNPSLLGGFGSATPLSESVMQTAPLPMLAAAQPAPTAVQPAPLSIITPQPAPIIPTQFADQAHDFSMPRPQMIAHEAAIVTESAEAAQAIEATDASPYTTAVPSPAVASPFDIATIEEQDKPKNRLRGGRNWRKWAIGGGAVAFSLLIGTGGLLFAQGYSNTNKVFRGSGSTAALTASADKVTLQGEDKGRVNILLLGNGGLGHDAPDLTDTIIVASIDTVHNTATMLSVPRDLWVQVPGSSPTKINAAYEIGKYNAAGKIDNTNNNTKAVLAGFATADKAVENVLGIDINYNMLVNFTSFKQAVDAVGGVNVAVPEALYDPTMAWENGGNPILAPAGAQSMNGTKALQYVRSRETSSDFARSQRQRTVILALKSKVLSAGTLSNPLKISGLLNAFGDNLVTDMSLSEGMRAYDLTKAVDNSKIQTVDLVTPPNNLITTGTIQSASVAYPRAGTFSYADIQKYMLQLFTPPAAATSTATTTTGATTATTTAPETAAISVLNGTARAGLAGTQSVVIKAAGYTIAQTGNAPSQAYAKTTVVDFSNGANPKTKKYLETLYGVTAVAQSPDATIQAGTAKFVVILGSDQVR
ncbi:LCP family protein [Aeromicrobium sp.]|nr:LCP family protein [Candidatus Saccharibacteria bacterium]